MRVRLGDVGVIPVGPVAELELEDFPKLFENVDRLITVARLIMEYRPSTSR